MRIFCAVRHSQDPQYYYGGLWSSNFYPALKQLSHEVVESQTDLLPASRFMHIANGFTTEEYRVRSAITERILAEVRREHVRKPIGLFLSYFYNGHFDPEGFEEMRRLGIPSINFFCNGIYQFELVREIAAKADFSWHVERDIRALYVSAGANPVWVQMGADPQVYHPVEAISRAKKACFVGQRYADRDRFVAALIRENIPIDLYGAGWKRDNNPPSDVDSNGDTKEYLGRKLSVAGGLQSYVNEIRRTLGEQGVISGIRRLAKRAHYRNQTRRITPLLEPYARGRATDLSEVFAGYELILNFSNVWADGRAGSALINQVRLRDFEAPMSRTCYLTGESDEIREFYDVGEEIDTYTSEAELIDKARFYLANPDVAENLRERGYSRAVSDHTWVRRFEELFSKIGLNRVN
jgi:spore maturation protein CgeB